MSSYSPIATYPPTPQQPTQPIPQSQAPTSYQPNPAYPYQPTADTTYPTRPGTQPQPRIQTPPQPTTSTQVLTRRRRGWRPIVAAACAAMVIGGASGAGAATLLTQQQVAMINTVAAPAPAAARLDGTVTAAAAAISPSVVTITDSNGQSGSVGSGIILDKVGHVLTNDHVVSGVASGRLEVTLSSGAVTTARVVGRSPESDLAVIALASSDSVQLSTLTPATFADSSSLVVGQSVVAVGAPLGLAKTVTSGVVSTLNRPVRSGENNEAVYQAVQTDAPINPGNSGGPLVDLDGRVVGINSAIASTGQSSQSGSQPGSVGIGFAIESNLAVRVAKDLIADGSAPMASLGVTLGGADQSAGQAPQSGAGENPGNTEAAGETAGATVQAVSPGSAAAQAGLAVGDRITAVDQLPIESTDSLIAAIRSYTPGATVRIEYQRNGSAGSAEVTLGTASS